MSRKKNYSEFDDIYYKNFFDSGCFLEDDENDDEDYNLYEDILINNPKHKNDDFSYQFSIPKREINDIMSDPIK
jgi:hypothetical protein